MEIEQLELFEHIVRQRTTWLQTRCWPPSDLQQLNLPVDGNIPLVWATVARAPTEVDVDIMNAVGVDNSKRAPCLTRVTTILSGRMAYLISHTELLKSNPMKSILLPDLEIYT
jgi:hypothetical protein